MNQWFTTADENVADVNINGFAELFSGEVMILITGATGNVGKELVPQLLEAGQQVRVLVRDERKVAHLDNRVERAVGDLDKPETLDAAMKGVEHMFLVDMSAQHVANTIAAAKKTGVQHIVKLSTLEASMADLPIGQWHREREEMLRASGVAWTFVRPGQFMSNALQWVGTVKQQGVVYSSYGDGKIAAIDPRDIAAVAAAALTQPGHTGQVYELTGPELHTTAEQVQTLAQVLDKPLRHVDIPPSAAREPMLRRGMPPALVEALIELMIVVRDGKGAQQTDTVERIIGRSPRTFETWCRDHITAFQ